MGDMGQSGFIDGVPPSTWINCTLSTSKCENDNWIFGGVSGICDKSSGMCTCPEGFSGLDDFNAYNDCHVSLQVRLNARHAALTIAFIAFIVSLCLTLRLLFKWGIIYIPNEPTDVDDVSEGNSNQENAPILKPSNSQAMIIGQSERKLSSPKTAISTLASSFKIKKSSSESTPKPRVSFEPLLGLSNSKLNNDSDDIVINQEKIFDQSENIQAPLPIIDEGANERVSQKYGLLILTQNHGSKTENLSSVDNSEESKQQIHSSQNESSNYKKLGKSKNDPQNDSTSIMNVKHVLNSVVPKRLPRASMKNIKQLIPSIENKPGPKTALMDELKRKRKTFTLITLCLGFSLFMVIYCMLLLYADLSHRANDLALDIFLLLIINCVLLGIWTFAYIWYRSLPNLATYGKLFKVDSILIRNPGLVPRLTAINVVFIIILTILFIIVFPRLFPAARYELDSALMIFGCLELIVFGSTFLSICYLLNNSFESILNNPLVKRSGKKEGAENAILRARNTVRFGAFVGVVGCVSCSLLFFLMAVVPVVRTNLWVIAPAMIAIGCSVELIIMYIIIIRTGGGTSNA